MRKHKGFTLVELLVVISIIAVLLAVLMPALNKARMQAKRLIDLSNLHSVMLACTTYSSNNNGYLPNRGKYFAGMPHLMIDSLTRKAVMNDILFKPYMADTRDKALFCQAGLLRYRNAYMGDATTSGYAVKYITLMYFNYPLINPGSKFTWDVKQPDFTKLYTVKGSSTPLWGCLTVADRSEELPKLSHSMKDEKPHKPEGMSTVRVSGAAEWVRWDNMEPFGHYEGGKTFYWPKN